MSEPEGKRNAATRAVAAARPGVRAWAGPGDGELVVRLWGRLADALNGERERGRFALWLPVAAIGGIVLFFAAERDPALWAAVAVFAICAVLAIAARARPLGFPVAMIFLAVSAGFLSAALQVQRVAAPVLAEPVRGVAVGTIESVEPRGRGVRIVLHVDSLAELKGSRLPARVRVTVPAADGLAAGRRVSVEALWRPPPGPARPGGYDFAREAFFMGLGAVGSRARAPVLLPVSELTWMQSGSAAIDRVRNAITARISAAVPGDAGAIAAALVAGQRGEISDEANDALRAAGLYHVISISGLHMALFGGTLFGVLRLALALIPGFGVRHPIKKWSAAAALAGAAGYLALSGAGIATQRSFVMIAVVFLAVICDRQGITMRNLALAAFAAILLFPEAVLGPSFQMSFCAVMAIVAWYEAASLRAPDEMRSARTGGVMRFIRVYFGGIIATTIAATLATAPFSAFHFQRLAVHALPGNLIALPIVSILVMPWALIGLLLMPFGLDLVAWRVMGFGIDIMLRVSAWIATWPAATLAIPAFAPAAVALLAFGLCWLTLWTTRLRWLGALPVAAGMAIGAIPPLPDVYVEPGGRAAAVRGPDGLLHLIGARFARFAAETWLAADGDSRTVRAAADGVRCDSLGCTAALPYGRTLAVTWTYAGLREDCRRAAIVVTRLVAPPSCRTTAYVIDAIDLAREGAVALNMLPDGSLSVRTARGAAERIWHGPAVVPAGPAFASPKPQAAKVTDNGFDPTDPEEDQPVPED